MNNCYACNIEIKDDNGSVEHIIPNSIGGQIKSNKLLCKVCNEKFGNTIDKYLNNQIGLFGTLLNVKRDRVPDKLFVQGQYDTGEVRYVGPGLKGGYKMIIPVEVEGKIIKKEIYPKTEKEFNRLKKQQEKSLKKKFGNIQFEEREEYNENKLLFSTKENPKAIGGREFFQAICKIAVNFFIFNGGDKSKVVDIVDFILDKNELKNAIFYYPDIDVIKRENDEIEHHILIRGDKQKRILYGYVELFSSHCVLIKFSESYSGNDLKMQYSYDLITGEEISKDIQIQLSREQFIGTFNPLVSHGRFQRKHNDLINRYFTIVEKKQDELKTK